MKKIRNFIVFIGLLFLLTGCFDLNFTLPGKGDLTVDHSVCEGSAFEINFQSMSAKLSTSSITSSAVSVNACYGVGGKKHYYGSSGFIYQRDDLDSNDEYTYYLITSNTGILHRFANAKAYDSTKGPTKENVTVLNDGIYEIVFDNGNHYLVSYLGGYEEADIAIFTFKTEDDLPVVTLGSSDELVIGEKVVAVGTPILGLTFINSVVQGYVSGLNRRYSYLFTEGKSFSVEITDHSSFQFDAPINGGMEGGPVFNAQGEVVGIIAYKYEEDIESLSLAIPISDVENIINTIISSEDHTYTRAMIGIGAYDLEALPGLALMTNTSYVSQGVYIDSISVGSPSATAGMNTKEIITGLTIGGEYFPIINMASLTGKLWRLNSGDILEVETKRLKEIVIAEIVVDKTIVTSTYILTV